MSEVPRDDGPQASDLGHVGRARRGLSQLAAFVFTAILNLVVTKPLAVFVWWLSNRANRIEFRERAELRRRVESAVRRGRPVLFASNHLSMFDDPVLPMALYRTGPRALAEYAALGALLALGWTGLGTLLPPELWRLGVVVFCAGIGVFGARKVWWSLGDFVNFSGSAALRGKLEAGREGALTRAERVLLAVANPAIRHFMRSRVVKTVLVDRRPGELARQRRADALEAAIEIAARGEPLWIFFEGGRAKVPGELGPARRGIGELILGLRERGLDPLVIPLRHRGLELVIPRDSKRWFTSGHCIEVQWSEWVPESGKDARSLADSLRGHVARIQLGKGDPATEVGPATGARFRGGAYRALVTLPGWLLMIAGCLVWGALLIPATLLLSRVWPNAKERFSDLTRTGLRLYLRSLLFVRFEVEEREQRLVGPRIVVANHQSWLDPIAMITIEPRLGGPVKRYLYRMPVLGSIVRLAGFFESDGSELPSLDRMQRVGRDARERNGGVLFFPEGTRSKTGEIGLFHRGAFRLAVDHDLPIQPVVIEGLDRVLPPGHWIAGTSRRYPVRIRYLPPVLPPFGSGLRRDVVRGLCERVRGSLVEELAQLRARRREISAR